MSDTTKFLGTLLVFALTTLVSFLLLDADAKTIVGQLLPMILGFLTVLVVDRFEILGLISEIRSKQKIVDSSTTFREMSVDEANTRIVQQASAIRTIKNTVFYADPALLKHQQAQEKVKKVVEIIRNNKITWEEVVILEERAKLIAGQISSPGTKCLGAFSGYAIKKEAILEGWIPTEFSILQYEDGEEELIFGFTDRVGAENTSRCFLTRNPKIIRIFLNYFEGLKQAGSRII